MRKPLLLLAVVLLLGLIPLGLAASWQNQDSWTTTLSNNTVAGALTVTPGASGAWVSGGYDFNGTANANRTAFKPLHNLEAFTILVWFTPDSIAAGDKMLLGQYVDLNNRLEVYQAANDMQFRLGTGAAYISLTLYNLLTVAHQYLAIMTWNKSLNSGKYTAYVYDLSVANTSTGTSATGHATNTTANAVMNLAKRIPSAAAFGGKMWQVQLLERKITQTEAEAARLGFLDTDLWRWDLDEASGIVFLPNAPRYAYQDGWSTSLVATAPYTPGWQGQDYWSEILDTPAPVVDISPFLPPWVSLLGMILLPVSLCYVPLQKRRNDEIRFDDLGMAAILFFLGLALMIGSVV